MMSSRLRVDISSDSSSAGTLLGDPSVLGRPSVLGPPLHSGGAAKSETRLESEDLVTGALSASGLPTLLSATHHVSVKTAAPWTAALGASAPTSSHALPRVDCGRPWQSEAVSPEVRSDQTGVLASSGGWVGS